MIVGASPNGLGLVEAQIVIALLELRAVDEYGVKTQRLLDHLSDRSIAPDLAHHGVVALAQPWRTKAPLIVPHGNIGSIVGDPPAEPRYTDVWLSALGAHAAKAELDAEVPLPIGLLLGDWHLGGKRPHFDPERFVAAMRHLIRSPRAKAGEVYALLGPPISTTGAAMGLDTDRLLRGLEVPVVESAVIQVEPPTKVIVSNPPLSSDLYWALEQISNSHDDELMSAADHSRSNNIRWEFTVKPTVDVNKFAAQLANTWPLRIERSAALGTSWRSLAAQWLETVEDHDQLVDRLALLVPPDERPGGNAAAASPRQT